MPERPKLPLDIQAAIEDARELAIKKLMEELPLLFNQESILPISQIHRATPKPAKLKLQLRQFASTLFDVEASRYPQHATSFQQLKDWLTALASIVEGEVAAELTPFAALHDFHCSRQERTRTVVDVLHERIEHWLKIAENLLVMRVTQGIIAPIFRSGGNPKPNPPSPVGSRGYAWKPEEKPTSFVSQSVSAGPQANPALSRQPPESEAEQHANTKKKRRMPSTITSPLAARRMEYFLGAKGIGQTEFATVVGVTDRNLRAFRTTGKIKRATFDKIAAQMGTTRDKLIDPTSEIPTG